DSGPGMRPPTMANRMATGTARYRPIVAPLIMQQTRPAKASTLWPLTKPTIRGTSPHSRPRPRPTTTANTSPGSTGASVVSGAGEHPYYVIRRPQVGIIADVRRAAPGESSATPFSPAGVAADLQVCRGSLGRPGGLPPRSELLTARSSSPA